MTNKLSLSSNKFCNFNSFSTLSIFLLIIILFVSSSLAHEIIKNYTPHRIILNLTDSPATSIAVTWRTLKKLNEPVVQVAEAKQWRNFKDSRWNVASEVEEFSNERNNKVYHYSTKLSGLKPNTNYLYRVGSTNEWSEWNQFTTSKTESQPFTFIYFGDPQNSVLEHCSRVFRQVFKKAGDANFWLFAGDLLGEPEDSLWGDFFSAAGFVFRVTPSILVPGNHDHPRYIVDGKHKRYKTIAPIWRPHFTLPENGIPGLEESSYYIDYQGVRFVMLNSQTKLEEQAVWLDEILEDNSCRWTIITLHHPLYSVGKKRDNKDTREAFLNVIDKHNVDLVLQGHDHTYARTYKLRNDKIVGDDEKGTVYIVSVSGPKAYDINPIYGDVMAKMGNKVQLFQVINVEENKLSIEAYTATGELYDSFELNK